MHTHTQRTQSLVPSTQLSPVVGLPLRRNFDDPGTVKQLDDLALRLMRGRKLVQIDWCSPDAARPGHKAGARMSTATVSCKAFGQALWAFHRGQHRPSDAKGHATIEAARNVTGFQVISSHPT